MRAREPSSIEGQRELGFAEAAIQEVAYETLSIRVRRPAHLLTAQWLERHAQGAGLGPRLAFHLDRGGDLGRAAAEYARAGAAAAALGQNHEALRHFQRAQEIHDASDAEGGAEQGGLLGTGGVSGAGDAVPTQRVAGWRERVALRLERGDVLRRIGRPDEAATAYAEARARVLAAERRSDEALAPGETERWQARVDFRLALLEKLSGHIAEARALVESAIARARVAGAEGDTPPMYALLVFLHRRARDPDASWAAALEGLRVSRRTRARGRADPAAASGEGPRPPPGPRWREDVVELLFGLAAALYVKQRMVAAERTYAQARRVLGDPCDPRLAGIALNGVAAARLARGDLPGARETFRRALRLKERAGDLHQIAVGCANLADVELKLGNAAGALEHAQRSVRLGEQSRAGSDLPAM
ncbi:MAG: protein kinase, partial [Polyangiaceae bacterium]